MFDVCVLAFVAATAGGLIRDVLIGAVPPAGISDWRYIATSLAAGAVTFLWYPRVQRLNTVILAFDAAGLGLFAVAGTEKALAYGLNPVASAMLGMLSGIGGGVVRDVLVNEVRRPARGPPRRRRACGRRGRRVWSGRAGAQRGRGTGGGRAVLPDAPRRDPPPGQPAGAGRGDVTLTMAGPATTDGSRAERPIASSAFPTQREIAKSFPGCCTLHR